MCNLYSLTKGQAAIRELSKALIDRTGNLPPMPGIFPNYPAPVVRNSAEGRELTLARWGMPSSQKALLDATKKRAASLEKKGLSVDFPELLRMEPDSGTTNGLPPEKWSSLRYGFWPFGGLNDAEEEART